MSDEDTPIKNLCSSEPYIECFNVNPSSFPSQPALNNEPSFDDPGPSRVPPSSDETANAGNVETASAASGYSPNTSGSLLQKQSSFRLGFENESEDVSPARPDNVIRPGKRTERAKGIMHLICRYCEEKFVDIVNFEGHLLSLHPEKHRYYPCGICGRDFNSMKFLNKHLITHTEEFKCDLCYRCFQSIGYLERHTRTYHTRY